MSDIWIIQKYQYCHPTISIAFVSPIYNHIETFKILFIMEELFDSTIELTEKLFMEADERLLNVLYSEDSKDIYLI